MDPDWLPILVPWTMIGAAVFLTILATWAKIEATVLPMLVQRSTLDPTVLPILALWTKIGTTFLPGLVPSNFSHGPRLEHLFYQSWLKVQIWTTALPIWTTCLPILVPWTKVGPMFLPILVTWTKIRTNVLPILAPRTKIGTTVLPILVPWAKIGTTFLSIWPHGPRLEQLFF